MRCHICNKTLSESEIQWNPLHNEWEPCGECLHEISEIFEDYEEETTNEIDQFEG